MIQRRKRNSSKVNLTISVVFHTVMIGAVFFFAAREGMLGKKLKQLTVTMVPKEKPPEAPKPKTEEPKPAPVKTEEAPKVAAVAPPRTEAPPQAPPPVADAAPAVAPAATALPAFEFNDGAKQVQTITDPSQVYKALVEHALLSRWMRPEDIDDRSFVAEVELTVSSAGKIESTQWLNGSGNRRWDDSVKTVLSQVRTINRPPPKGFPPSFRVRFDVESQQTEPAIQVTSVR